MVTGPVTVHKLLTYRAANMELKIRHQAYFDSRDRDVVKMAAGRAGQLVDSTLNKNARLSPNLLRQMKPYVPRQQTRLVDKDGLVVESQNAEKHIVMNHFAEMLEGEITTMNHHIQQQRLLMPAKAVTNSTVQRTLEAVPSLPYIKEKCVGEKHNTISEN